MLQDDRFLEALPFPLVFANGRSAPAWVFASGLRIDSADGRPHIPRGTLLTESAAAYRGDSSEQEPWVLIWPNERRHLPVAQAMVDLLFWLNNHPAGKSRQEGSPHREPSRVSAPITARSEAGAIFELLAQFGCRMPADA